MSGSFVISLDLELRWGVPGFALGRYRENLLGVRRAVPAMLALFERYDIAATWATVGALFARDRDELRSAMPTVRPGYAGSPFDTAALFDACGASEADDPIHYAGSLIDAVLRAPRQELATHTFSHFHCLEPTQRPAAFRAELEAAKRLAEARGVTLRSIVFPCNQYGDRYLDIARQAGLVCFRGVPEAYPYRSTPTSGQTPARRLARLADHYFPLVGTDTTVHAARNVRGLWDVRATRFLRPTSPALRAIDEVRLARICLEITRAAQRGQVAHLWWHCHNFGRHLDLQIAFLEAILLHVDRLRASHGLLTETMSDVADRWASTPERARP